MSFTEFYCERTGDKYYRTVHSSGVTIYVYPQEGRASCYAIFGTKFGSIDDCFTVDGREINVPAGVAHFLEHKLFENEDSEVFELFAENGADANAYTSYEKTCYLFSCTDRFEDNLRILLDFVRKPYFTKESVDKEQGIIAQEIGMYEDNPDWCVFNNMIRSMYKEHPVRISIAGTTDSIAQIDHEMLYTCYNAFYTPSNMVLSVAGDVTPEQVLTIADEMLTPGAQAPQRIVPEEDESVVQTYVEENFDVSAPMFSLGFKEKLCELTSEKLILTEIVLELLSGRPSELFNRLLEEGLINHSFGADFMYWDGVQLTVFSGESSDPQRMRNEINAEIRRLKTEGISQSDFEWAQRSVYGAAVAQLDNALSIANSLADAHFADENIFEQVEAAARVTREMAQERLLEMLNEENSTMSVVKRQEADK